MAFGKSQLKNPTPAGTALTLDIIAAIAGVMVAAVNNADFIPHDITSIISWLLGTIVALTLAIKPFFGVKPTSSTVPIEDVGSMDAPDK